MTRPWVIMRSRNDMPIVRETLAGLASQTVPHELIVFDNDSTDGTREAVEKQANQVINVPAGTYVPGKVINQAMALAHGPYVVFINSDCVPQHPEWLEKLLAGFATDQVAAVFGRQIARPDCWPLFAKDTEDTFDDGRRQQFWRHCFSMAACAIRRSTWEHMPFSTAIQYSEDIEWTWRARQAGFTIAYVADAVVMHSHNYTLNQSYRRNYGEGKAEAHIFTWTRWQQNWLRYSLMPLARAVLADWRYCLKGGYWSSLPHSPALRTAQMLGRRRGFLEGLKEQTR